MALEWVFWHWWTLGAILLIVELLAPGMFFLWMGESAIVTGAILWLFPALQQEYQVIVFSLLSLVSVGVSRRFLSRNPIQSDHPLLNQRTAQLRGREFRLDQAIVNGRGKIRVDDSSWRVEGEETPVGERVRVVDAEGVILKVERVRPDEGGDPGS